jgi:PAS domain S-box-containing protein
LLHAIIDTAPHLIFAKDCAGRLTYVNYHITRLFKCDQQHLLGRTAFDLYSLELARHIRALEQRVLETANTVETEMVLPVDGEPRTFISTQFPLCDAAGDIYGIGGVAVDVTPYKQAETDLHEQQKLFGELIEHVPASLVVKDLAGRVVLANQRAAASHQRTPHDMVGKTAEELFPARFAQMIVAAEQQVRETRAPVENEIVCPTSSRLFSSVRFPIYDTQGEFHYIGVISTDITERKHAHEQMLQQQQALAVLRERERLARELHDDMGQVLGTVQMQAQTILALLSQGDTVAAQRQVRNMLAVSRQGNDSVRDFIAGVQVHSAEHDGWFGALEHYLRRFHELYGIQVDLDIASELEGLQHDIMTPGIESQVLRIVQEALANVRKHAASQHAHIGFALQHDWLHIRVRDGGQGFDPASTTTQQGYGLRSMRERAAEIGGQVRIESAPGLGTTVVIQIPRYTQPPIDTVRILIVDDHPLFLLGLRNMLIAHNLNVVATAQNGEEAIQQARVLHPDIVLMDIQMPQCNGLDAARQIKADLPNTRIVMLSMFDDDTNLFEALKAGASGYVPKNLDADEFLRLLRGLLRGEVALEARMVNRVLEEFGHQEPRDESPPPAPETTPHAHLSARQIEILALVAGGYTYREVGDRLGFSERTVKYHMGEIIKRLHLRNRAEAIAYASQQGWLERER